MSRFRGLRGEEYEIVSVAESTRTEDPLELSDEHFAYSFLARLAQDPLNLPELRAVAADLGFGFSSYNTDDPDLLRFLAGHLVSRRLRVVGLEEERVIVDSGVPEELETEAPPVKAPEAPEEKTWIRFQVLHDETGLPVPGVQLTVRYPDGTSKDHWTHEDGLVELTDIPRGSYAIDRMARSDPFEVVSQA